MTFSAIFDSKVPPYGTLGRDHESLARFRDGLEELANQNDLTSLSTFESYEPEDLEGLLADDEETLPDVSISQWFSPAAGLEAVNALLVFVGANADVLVKQADVMKDLAGLRDELEAAQRAGVRFRFAMIM